MTLALVEHENGFPDELSLEMLTMARDLAAQEGEDLEAVVIAGEEPVTEELGAHGVETIHRVTHERLDAYAPEAWGESLAQVARETNAGTIVGPGSDRSHEVLAHAGAVLDAPMATNCVDLEVDPGGSYELTRQRWGGSLLEHAHLEGDVKLVTAAEHEYPIEAAAEPADPTTETMTPSLEDAHFRVQVDRVETGTGEGIPLGEARVVVGGGRGVGGPENFDQLEELADLLGGTVGSSRAAVNEGWRPHDDQIGQTGAKISPDIYVACGISGAVQHMVGCKGSERTLAINTDPEAAIIQKADWAVVGDLHEVVPALNEAIRERQ